MSKIRRRLTVQGESETIDGAALASLKEKAKEKTEDVRNVFPNLLKKSLSSRI
jgi:hypothetical protein